jgi:hypothetical protein
MVKVCASLLRAAQYLGDDGETPGTDWEVLKGTGNGVGTICKSGLGQCDNNCQTFLLLSGYLLVSSLELRDYKRCDIL